MAQKTKIYISAICVSRPGTMGGNTKILLELINNLSDRYDFIIFTSKPDTFLNNISEVSKIKILSVTVKEKNNLYLYYLEETKSALCYFRNFFQENRLEKNDFFYSASDAAPDVLPVINLKRKFEFCWIASLFLFIPSPWENLRKKHKFPLAVYAIYFLLQRILFRKILKKFDLCLVTNDYDKNRFPQSKQKNLLAIYGGINKEQIEEAKKEELKKIYDAVFCGRLHPQKGISQLLEIWSIVVRKKPQVKLAIIGNGEKSYENFLREKAKRLKIDKNIFWLGYVNGIPKYKIYKQSKIFLHSTIYDNNGMAAAEALCSGLPVIMYDLKPLEKIYDTGCIKIKSGNKKEYAAAIIKLLENKNQYNKIKPNKKQIQELIDFWDWGNRAKIFEKFLEKSNKI